MKITWFVAAATLLAACGETKPAAQSVPAADSTQRIQAPPPDRIAPAPEMTVRPADPVVKQKADSTKPAAPIRKADDRLRDSAFGPKFTVDSNGKVRPLKRPQ